MSDSHLIPQAPPFASEALPATGGRLGPELEDFVVDEVPAYLPSGSGEHLYVRIKKRGLTTQEAIQAIARAAGIAQRDVGSAGMKDKHAVTSQWLSLPGRGSVAPESWQLPAAIEVIEVSRHNNKLRTGHLSGNRFELRLIEVESDALDKAVAIASLLEQRGLPNYFGAQRFGVGGKNLFSAVRWLRSASGGTRFYNKLYPSVIQAEVFNRYLGARARLGFERLIEGEVVRLEGSRAVFTVEDVNAEQARYDARNLQLTGPIFGPKMRQASGTAAQLEHEALESIGLDGAALDKLGAHAPGTRRDLLVYPHLRITAGPTRSLSLSFELPAGSYATQVVRELTRSGFIAEPGERSDLGSPE